MSGDAAYMRRAADLAEKGWGCTNPNPMVGAVIVRDGVIIGEGYHHKCGDNHAEVDAIADAARRGEDTAGATIYVTLEPCSTHGRRPPCTDALLAAGVKRVVIGCVDPNPAHAGRGVDILRQKGVEVICGVEEELCQRLNAPFFKWIISGTPFVILKMAMTLDGKIATSDGNSKYITGVSARTRVQRLRCLADAIMVGGETVRRDRPQLTVRTPDDWAVQPRRLIVSSTLSAADAAELMPGGRTPEVFALPDMAAWGELMNKLGAEHVMVLLVEGGGELAASALVAGVVDYVEFHIAPKILGGRHSRPVIGGDDPGSLTDALELTDVRSEFIGEDIAISGFLKKAAKNCLQD